MNVTENSDTKKITQVANRYITTLLKRKKQEERKNSFEEKIAKKIAAFTGSMMFVYIHIALLSTWFFWNAGWLGLKPFDPSFIVLAMFASAEAIFLSTILLISQNRMTAQANKSAGVELLTEHKITKLIEFIKARAEKMETSVELPSNRYKLSEDIQPDKVTTGSAKK